MRAMAKLLAGGAAAAALACAAPAAAQYYPGYGYPAYPYGGNPVGQVVNQVFGGGYGYNQQAVVNQCVGAVQQRLSGGYGYGYAYGGYRRGRVLGISRVEPRSTGGFTVRGVATSGRYAGYGYAAQRPDLTWRCRTDYRGFITAVDLSLAQPANGYGYAPQPYAPYGDNYSPYQNDYSQYGYHRH